MEHALELGLIGSAWHGTSLGVLEGIAKTKEIGFDSYDVFEDPLTTSDDERRAIKETCEELGLPIRSAVCIALGLVDFVPSVRRFTLDRCKAYIDQQAYFGGRNVLLVAGEYYCDLQVFSKEEIFGLVAENLRELAEHAEPQGIELAIELEPFKHAVANSVHELADLIRLVDHPAVKANADVSHLHLSGASFEDVAVLARDDRARARLRLRRQGARGHAARTRRDADQGVPAGDPRHRLHRHGVRGARAGARSRPDGRARRGVLPRDGTDPGRARRPQTDSVAGPFDLTGRRALVTGGGGGIGRGLARALADAGASVAVLGRSESAEEAAVELGGIAVRADLADRDDLRRGFAEAVERLGGLDILVASHGIGRAADAVDHDLADWDEVIEVNLTATFELCQLAGRIMVAQGSGKIVNIASVLSFQGGLRVSSYAASKGGVSQLTMALANEWAPHGVNVNAIAPGYVKTALNARIWRDDPERTAQIDVRIPAGRWGEPADIGGAVVFLSSAASDYVQGVTLPVDGGWLSR